MVSEPKHADEASSVEAIRNEGTSLPPVGKILNELRLRRGLSLRQVAEATDLSLSFLSAIERDESDIALGRLARLAAFFGHDVGSLLGYTARKALPQFVQEEDRVLMDRGPGVSYELLRVPEIDASLVFAEFGPGAGCLDDLTHEGVDVVLVLKGELVLHLNGADYPIQARQCATWSGAYAHHLHNDSAEQSIAIVLTSPPCYY